MPDTDHIQILKQGKTVWNKWRSANPDIRPILAGKELTDLDLAELNLSEADLSKADLDGVDLRGANLKMARLREADLTGVNMSGADLYKADFSRTFLTESDLSNSYAAGADFTNADLRGAKLEQANLTEANLSSAELGNAQLTEANLTQANITGADFCYATLASANLLGVRYGSFRSMKGHYYGIRGLDSCYGNALFVRDAQDQDYLDTLEHHISQTPSPLSRKLKRLAFACWELIDYGRSLGKPTLYAVVIAMTYGMFYFVDMIFQWGLIDYSNSAKSWLSPFYYSIVTYTTLGFGDITPKHWLGEIVVVSEVVLGYLTLGLLLSILANKVARRS
jgi:hypothetical protein